MTDTLKAVLFDVDGTLVDTNYPHVVCWWEAFSQAGFNIPMARIHRAMGMGSDQMLDALLPEDRDRDEDGSMRAAHSALYATYWTREKPLPGAVDLLRACRDRGWQVVLASSADEREFEALRTALDADDAINAATNSANVEQSKPAPDLVQVALDKAKVSPDAAVFVGDTVWDVQASGKAGVACIGVLSGGIGRDELLGAGAAEVYDGPAALLEAVRAKAADSILGRGSGD
ncbi:MAG TPA: HAD family hydrolase [Streptosporangiaceae bacterium]